MRHFGIVALVGLMAIPGQVFVTGPAAAAVTPAGKAVGVNPSASDVAKTTTRTLVVGGDVTMGDRIITGSSGQVQLIFNDETHLVVGPSSSLVIESYLLRNDKSVGQFAVNALGGTFRFMTGQSDHSAYKINTPTGTIGVRGTAFDFTVAADGAAPKAPAQFLPGTTVALFRGAVTLCNLANQCVTLSRRCDVGTITTPNASRIGPFDAATNGLRARFRYIASQRPLLRDFWIDESRLCLINNAPGGSLSTPPGGGGKAPPPQRGRN